MYRKFLYINPKMGPWALQQLWLAKLFKHLSIFFKVYCNRIAACFYEKIHTDRNVFFVPIASFFLVCLSLNTEPASSHFLKHDLIKLRVGHWLTSCIWKEWLFIDKIIVSFLRTERPSPVCLFAKVIFRETHYDQFYVCHLFVLLESLNFFLCKY